MPMTARLYRKGILEDADLDPASSSDHVGSVDALLWIDVNSPTKADMERLQHEFGFHELAIEDSLHPHQRPKIEQYDDYFFLVAYGVTATQEEMIEHELAVFISDRYVVTVRKDPALDLTRATKRWEARPERLCEGGGYLLYVILDEIVDGYFDALDTLEDRAEEVEEAVLQPDGRRDAQTEIFTLRKELFRFRRASSPLREVLDVMQRRTLPVVTAELEPYYRDVYDHVLRTTDFVDNLRDVLSNTFDAHLSAVSNRLNEVMKVLTSWAAIILVPTLIAGIYGMNFTHMPELTWRYGYAYALGLMLVSGLVLHRMFRRRGWL